MVYKFDSLEAFINKEQCKYELYVKGLRYLGLSKDVTSQINPAYQHKRAVVSVPDVVSYVLD